MKNSKSQITNNKQITMTKIQNDKHVALPHLFRSLDIEIWDFLGIRCLGFEISKVLNTRDIISKDYPYIEYSTVKFHKRVTRSGLKECSPSLNPEP